MGESLPSSISGGAAPPQYPADTLHTLLKLSLPIFVGELGFAATGLITTFVAGRAEGKDALWFVSLGGPITSMSLLFIIGTLLSVQVGASMQGGPSERAFGLRASMALGAFVCFFCIAAALVAGLTLIAYGDIGNLRTDAQEYLVLLLISIPALTFSTVFRFYCEGRRKAIVTALIGLVGALSAYPVMMAAIATFGVLGLGWGYSATAWLQFAAVAAFALNLRRKETQPTNYDRLGTQTRRALTLSLHTGLMYIAQSAPFVMVGFLGPLLGRGEAAINQICVSVTSFLFMAPLAIASATTITVAGSWSAGHRASVLRLIFQSLTIAIAYSLICLGAVTLFADRIFDAFLPRVAMGPDAYTALTLAGVVLVLDSAQKGISASLIGIGMEKRVSGISALCGTVSACLAWHFALGMSLGAVGLWSGLIAGTMLSTVLLGMTLLRVRRSN